MPEHCNIARVSSTSGNRVLRRKVGGDSTSSSDGRGQALTSPPCGGSKGKCCQAAVERGIQHKRGRIRVRSAQSRRRQDVGCRRRPLTPSVPRARREAPHATSASRRPRRHRCADRRKRRAQVHRPHRGSRSTMFPSLTFASAAHVSSSAARSSSRRSSRTSHEPLVSDLRGGHDGGCCTRSSSAWISAQVR